MLAVCVQQGIEFLWDEDAGDDDEGRGVGRESCGALEGSEGSGGSDVEKDRQDAGSEESSEDAGDGNGGLSYPDRLRDGDDEDDDDNTADKQDGAKGDNRRSGGVIERKWPRPEVEEEDEGPGAAVAAATSKGRGRVDGRRRGVELDEHLARFLR